MHGNSRSLTAHQSKAAVLFSNVVCDRVDHPGFPSSPPAYRPGCCRKELGHHGWKCSSSCRRRHRCWCSKPNGSPQPGYAQCGFLRSDSLNGMSSVPAKVEGLRVLRNPVWCGGLFAICDSREAIIAGVTHAGLHRIGLGMPPDHLEPALSA